MTAGSSHMKDDSVYATIAAMSTGPYHFKPVSAKVV